MFCATATVIDRCKTEGVVDVFQVVKALRVNKPGAVPTLVMSDQLLIDCTTHMLSSMQENYNTIFDATLVFLDSLDNYANFHN